MPRPREHTASSSPSSSRRRWRASSSSLASAVSGQHVWPGWSASPLSSASWPTRSTRACHRRERPAGGPRSARGGARISPAGRRLRAHPGARRRACRQGPRHGGQHDAPAGPPPERAGRHLQPAHQRRARAGAWRPVGRSASTCSARSSTRRSRSVRPRSSSAGSGTPKSTEAVGPADAAGDPELERVEEDLRKSLGTKVSLTRSRRGGRIVIEYYSDEELGRLYERLTGGTA